MSLLSLLCNIKSRIVYFESQHKDKKNKGLQSHYWTLHQHVFIACTGLKFFKYRTLFSIRLQKNIDCSMLVAMYFRFSVTKHNYYTGQYFF